MFRVSFLTIFAVLSNYACARPFEEVTRPLEMTHHCCLSKLSTLTLVDVSVEAYSEEVVSTPVVLFLLFCFFYQACIVVVSMFLHMLSAALVVKQLCSSFISSLFLSWSLFASILIHLANHS